MKDESKKVRILTLVWGGFALLWLAGAFFPEPFWGLNAFAFLSGAGTLLLVNMAALIFWLSWKSKLPQNLPFLDRPAAAFLLPALLAGTAGALAYALPMLDDQYGDFFFIRRSLNVDIQAWDPRLWTEFSSLDFSDSKLGTQFFYSIINLTVYFTGWTGEQALQILQALSAALFAWTWARWIMRRIHDWVARLSLLAIGLLSPLMLNFANHHETYGFILVAYLAFAAQLDRFLHNPKALNYLALILLWLVVWKFHVTGFILFAAVLLGGLWWWGKGKEKWERLFTWKQVLRWLVLPGILLVIFVYVYVTDSWNGERSFDPDNLNEVLFLPVKSSEAAPLDRYNLFSGAHILDYLNSIWMPGAAALFILVASLTAMRKAILWNHIALLLPMTLLLAFWGVFFLMNPLLGLTHDWDLFCISAPLLLTVALQLTAQLRNHDNLRRIALLGLSLAILGSGMLLLHQDRKGLGERYVSISKRLFKTVWISSSSRILGALEVADESHTFRFRLEEVIEDLDGYGVEGNDLEYANLHHEMGKIYYTEDRDYPNAEKHFREAHRFLPTLLKNPFFLVTTLFMQQKYKDASEYAQLLAGLGYPSREKALRMAIHVNLEAENAQQAQEACEAYTIEFPADTLMQNLYRDMRMGLPMAQLKGYFRSE